MKIIIFGANGMLGNYVMRIVDGIKIPITRKEYDIEKKDWFLLKNILKHHNPDIVVNCAGLIPQRINTETPYNNNEKYFIINGLFPNILSVYCNELNIKFIHITTDCVFSGKKGLYTEEDTPDETNLYGLSKSIGEPSNATIIRTSIIGHEINNKKSLLEWVISQKNKKINGFSNHYWNGITCLQLSYIINKIINENMFWIGVRHINSPNTVSKYELVYIINDIYDLNLSITNYTTTQTIDKSLSSIYKPMFTIPDIGSQIKELYNKFNEIK
jgi:dTDP-4-dehydrorhamnose reductase